MLSPSHPRFVFLKPNGEDETRLRWWRQNARTQGRGSVRCYLLTEQTQRRGEHERGGGEAIFDVHNRERAQEKELIRWRTRRQHDKIGLIEAIHIFLNVGFNIVF